MGKTRSKSTKGRCKEKAQVKAKIDWRKECNHPYVWENKESRTLPRDGDIVIYYPHAIAGSLHGPDGWHLHDSTARIIKIHLIEGIDPSDGGYCDVKYRYSLFINIPYRGKGVNPCGVFHPSDAGDSYWPHLMTTAAYQENKEGISYEWSHGNYNDDNVWQSYTGQWCNLGSVSQPKWRRIDTATSKADADRT